MRFRTLLILIISVFITNCINAQEKSIAITLGNFDVLNQSYRSPEARIEYRFAKLKYDVIPFSGLMFNSDGAFFIYYGLQYDINIFDMFYLTPSFSPGIYEKGKSKDLDFFLEFKTQVELSIKTNDNSRIGIGFSHISNGRLSLINPGVESLTFTFIFPM